MSFMNVFNHKKKLIFLLPNALTTLNLSCGFIAIIFLLENDVYHSCMMVLLGALFDSIDGKIARMTGSQSDFGEQFDSLSDVISFGVAPALLINIHILEQLDFLGLFGSVFFLICGTLRLARFNISTCKKNHEYFQGLPIPAAALGLVGFVLCSLVFIELQSSFYLALGYTIFLSFLMISHIPFPSLKTLSLIGKYKKSSFFIIFFAIAILFMNKMIMISLLVNLYIVIAFVVFLSKKWPLAHVLSWNGK